MNLKRKFIAVEMVRCSHPKLGEKQTDCPETGLKRETLPGAWSCADKVPVTQMWNKAEAIQLAVFHVPVSGAHFPDSILVSSSPQFWSDLPLFP